MYQLQDRQLARLMFDCALRRDHRSCVLFDILVAILRMVSVLESRMQLEIDFLPRIKTPPGPDPVPILTQKDMDILLGKHKTVPDTEPARIFPTAEFSSDRVRISAGIESATKLRDALRDVISGLDNDIASLQKLEQ